MVRTEDWIRRKLDELRFVVSFSLTRLRERTADFFGDLRDRVAMAWGQMADSAAERERVRNTPKPVIAPERIAVVPAGRRVYAIGDVHGRADLLERLLDELDADVERGGFEGRPILVFLGDYVDRGFQSKGVLDLLLDPRLSRYETYFLKGNHEAAMLQFLDDPAIGPRWAEYGGVETLVSYKVQPPRTRTNIEEWERASAELNEAMSDAHKHLLRNLDLSVRIGDYLFVHAGVRPGVALDQQTERDLLWIREEFLQDRNPYEAVIVHGHTPTTAPFKDSRRIGIDTGAYLSGKLTAVRLEGDQVDFMTAGASTAPQEARTA